MDILFSQGSSKKTTTLSDGTIKDIALFEVVEHLSSDQEERRFLRKIVSAIPCDTKDMIFSLATKNSAMR